MFAWVRLRRDWERLVGGRDGHRSGDARSAGTDELEAVVAQAEAVHLQQLDVE
jgi:hypothetical protein